MHSYIIYETQFIFDIRTHRGMFVSSRAWERLCVFMKGI